MKSPPHHIALGVRNTDVTLRNNSTYDVLS